jgi:peptide/nickel transport system permease protein
LYTYIVRRILLMIPMMFFVSVVLFAMSHLAPGDPLAGLELTNAAKQNPHYVEQIRHAYGLDQPVYLQYFTWLKNIFKGDFGFSMAISKGIPVSNLLHDPLINTLKLGLAAEIIILIVSIPVGILVARKRNTWVDYMASGFSFVTLSTPTFFIGLIFIYVFAITLQILPSSGTVDPNSDGGFFDQLRHIILPAFTLAVVSIATYLQFMKSSILDNLRMDFVRTARAKGLRERTVIYKHVLRNALIPIVTLFGLDITTILGGAPITEYIYNWPGLGQLGITAITERDYPVIMSINILGAFAVLLGNLIADILYAVVDPRIRLD